MHCDVEQEGSTKIVNFIILRVAVLPQGRGQIRYIVAVELQPYGSKNFGGYRRAVEPPIQKT
jgi:hypothetical protein